MLFWCIHDKEVEKLNSSFTELPMERCRLHHSFLVGIGVCYIQLVGMFNLILATIADPKKSNKTCEGLGEHAVRGVTEGTGDA